MPWQWQKLLCHIRWYCLMGLDKGLWALQEFRNLWVLCSYHGTLGCRCTPLLHMSGNNCHIQKHGKDSTEDTKWYCYFRSGWKEFWLKWWVAGNNIKTLVSICDHLRNGLTASAPGFQHFLSSGGGAELRAVRDILPRMLDNVIWYLEARGLSKASAGTCD